MLTQHWPFPSSQYLQLSFRHPRLPQRRHMITLVWLARIWRLRRKYSLAHHWKRRKRAENWLAYNEFSYPHNCYPESGTIWECDIFDLRTKRLLKLASSSFFCCPSVQISFGSFINPMLSTKTAPTSKFLRRPETDRPPILLSALSLDEV